MPEEVSAQMKEAQKLWQDPGVAERYSSAENATRPFAKLIVEKAGFAQLDKEAHVFDLATGTGAAIQELYDAVPKEKWGNLKVLGGDMSEGMLDYLKARGEKAGWTGLETRVIDGNKLDLPANTYTHIFVTFAIFVMPNTLPALLTLLKPGGFIGISTWAYLPWHPLLAHSISQMSAKPYAPSSAELENKMFSGRPWGDASYVSQQLKEAGFKDVEIVQETRKGKVGSPKTFMETMQFPLMLVKGFWEEEKREEWLKELNVIMQKDVVQMAGGEEGTVEMEFGAIVGYGWKGA